jgi:hypothetical protein
LVPRPIKRRIYAALPDQSAQSAAVDALAINLCFRTAEKIFAATLSAGVWHILNTGGGEQDLDGDLTHDPSGRGRHALLKTEKTGFTGCL